MPGTSISFRKTLSILFENPVSEDYFGLSQSYHTNLKFYHTFGFFHTGCYLLNRILQIPHAEILRDNYTYT